MKIETRLLTKSFMKFSLTETGSSHRFFKTPIVLGSRIHKESQGKTFGKGK